MYIEVYYIICYLIIFIYAISFYLCSLKFGNVYFQYGNTKLDRKNDSYQLFFKKTVRTFYFVPFFLNNSWIQSENIASLWSKLKASLLCKNKWNRKQGQRKTSKRPRAIIYIGIGRHDATEREMRWNPKCDRRKLLARWSETRSINDGNVTFQSRFCSTIQTYLDAAPCSWKIDQSRLHVTRS